MSTCKELLITLAIKLLEKIRGNFPTSFVATVVTKVLKHLQCDLNCDNFDHQRFEQHWHYLFVLNYNPEFLVFFKFVRYISFF